MDTSFRGIKSVGLPLILNTAHFRIQMQFHVIFWGQNRGMKIETPGLDIELQFIC